MKTIFVVFIFTQLSDNLKYQLDLQPAYFTEEPWTIVTSIFVHAGFFHILGNMITLYFFGTYLTMLVGEVKFIFIYVVGGLVGGALFILACCATATTGDSKQDTTARDVRISM